MPTFFVSGFSSLFLLWVGAGEEETEEDGPVQLFGFVQFCLLASKLCDISRGRVDNPFVLTF